MKVAINALSVQKQNTGIGNYTHRLIKNIAKIYNLNDFYIYVNASACSRFEFFHSENVIKLNLNNKLIKLLYSNFLLAHILNKSHIDLYHGTNFYIPFGLNKPSVITIHDLAIYKYPETFEKIHNLYAKTFLPYSIKKADQIIAVSENTKKDIIDMFNIDEERIKVIYLAADKIFELCSREEIDKIKHKFHLNKYILSVGTLEPRKNLIRLLKAYKNILPLLPEDYKLVVVGKKGWLYKDIFKIVEGFDSRIVITDYVTDEELRALYNGAELFIYASLYEGFGLPVVEAMSCGTPIITSNVSSLPEVVGEAGITVDPYNINQLSKAALEVVRNEELRRQMKYKSIERAELFSWKKVAEETMDVYRKTYEKKERDK